MTHYRYLCEQRRDIAQWLDSSKFPSCTCYYRRYLRAYLIYTTAIRLQGEQAIKEGIANPEVVAGDKSLIQAKGQVWHMRLRRLGKVPAGVNTKADWGYSDHDDWVYGFVYEEVVSATPGSTVFPLLASFASSNTSETRTFPDKVPLLPLSTKKGLLDSGYDSNYLGEHIEFDEHGIPTGRRLLCSPNPRNNERPKRKPGNADASRAQSRILRSERIKLYQSKKGRRLYARRSKTVEPFNQWFKLLYELEERGCHRGLENNQTLVLGAIFAYQLLVRYNGRIRWIMDALCIPRRPHAERGNEIFVALYLQRIVDATPRRAFRALVIIISYPVEKSRFSESSKLF